MSSLCELPSPSRRSVLASSGALFAWAFLPKFARAAGARDPRLIVIILRGALDGLSTVGPVGDPSYVSLHGALALSASGDHPAVPLDGFFALNPAMPVLGRLFKEGHATIIHATATSYRERFVASTGRMCSKADTPALARSIRVRDRALAALPAGDRVGHRSGLAVGPTTPLAAARHPCSGGRHNTW